jgi:hypothetical protein
VAAFIYARSGPPHDLHRGLSDRNVGFTLVTAGLLIAANIGGIVGRIARGGIADLRLAPRQLLGLIGVASAGCARDSGVWLGWPVAAILATSAMFGATAIGWNGVMLSEVARLAPSIGPARSPAHRVVTGGVMPGHRRVDCRAHGGYRSDSRPAVSPWLRPMAAAAAYKVSAYVLQRWMPIQFRSCRWNGRQ